VNDPLPGAPLRIAVLGDFDGPHTRSWLRVFVERGHDVHAISYYQPRAELPGVTLHVLSGQTSRRAEGQTGTRTSLSRVRTLIPPSLLRYVHAWRYRRAGLRALLDELRPDVFHAHYAVEHGFYGAVGYHPYVVSAWGSDLLVESRKLLGRRIARHALHAADLVTGNDASLVKRAIELGVAPEKTALVHLGIERLFLEAGEHSVNFSNEASEPSVISFRALERLYNIDSLILSFIELRHDLPNARLVIAGDGSERARLEALVDAYDLSKSVRFVGRVDHALLPRLIAASHVYVSVPSSDSLALSNLEAMAAGAFPIVSDLPSVDGWIEHGVNGLRVPLRNVDALAGIIQQALNDPDLRRRAALHNRTLVEARGLREPNMLLMERHYYRLTGHPVEERGAI
jgi:glycosyltransferase involved in cell wall biosynthesis